MVKLRKALFLIYRFLVVKSLWLLITLGDIFMVLPIVFVSSLKRKRSLPSITDDLLLIPAIKLAEMIRDRALTSEKLVSTYIERIKAVNPILNAVVEDRFALALEEAKRVDLLLLTRQDSLELAKNYPLLGVPITVKESIAVFGMSHNGGMVSSTRKKADKDADSVKKLKAAGAIILAVTNTPELCMDWECYNNVTGKTSNPYDDRRTSGGSSGGEGALLGAAASVIGLGSDALGSLRLPAHFCGIFSHKPTGCAVSIDGHFPRGEEEVYKKFVCIGPMARYSKDLPFLLKIICREESIQALNLDREIDCSNLKIFYTTDWESELLHPISVEIADAIHATLTYFHQKHKATIHKWDQPNLAKIGEQSLLSQTSAKGVDDIFDKDPTRSAALELLKFCFGLSDHTFYPISYLLLHRHLPVYDLEKIRNYIQKTEKTVASILGDNGVLICPVFPVDAPYHREIFTKGYNNVYMSVFNSLGLPVTCCPVGFTRKGLPIGLQIVGKPNSDRLTMAVAEEMEKLFGGWTPP